MGKESTNFPQMTNKTITQSNDFNSKLNVVKSELGTAVLSLLERVILRTGFSELVSAASPMPLHEIAIASNVKAESVRIKLKIVFFIFIS